MIYTLTLNPYLDYTVHLDRFAEGLTNRSSAEEYSAGGKGINVSVILRELGFNSTALGFTAGFTGEEIERRLKDIGVKTDFIRLQDGISRINIKLKTAQESEINAKGPAIRPQELHRLMEKINAVQNGDTLVMAGSIPGTLPNNIYEMILQKLDGRMVRTVVDAEKDLLLRTLPYRPFLIKPNRQELSEIFSAEVKDHNDAVLYAKQLQERGAQNVIVSLGSEGAVMVDTSGKVYGSGVLKETVRNTVGAGDSMVAGFIAGCEQNYDAEHSFRLASACGNAAAFSEGFASAATISNVYRQLYG